MLELDLSEEGQKISFPGDNLVEGIDKVHKSVPFVLGRIKDFKPTINELKLFKEDYIKKLVEKERRKKFKLKDTEA